MQSEPRSIPDLFHRRVDNRRYDDLARFYRIQSIDLRRDMRHVDHELKGTLRDLADAYHRASVEFALAARGLYEYIPPESQPLPDWCFVFTEETQETAAASTLPDVDMEDGCNGECSDRGTEPDAESDSG